MSEQPQNRFTRDDIRNHLVLMSRLSQEHLRMNTPEYTIADYRLHLEAVYKWIVEEQARVQES